MSIAHRSRGRPKSEVKRDAVINAARSLFLRHGVEGFSLDAFIAAAGVSKANLYSNFAEYAGPGELHGTAPEPFHGVATEAKESGLLNASVGSAELYLVFGRYHSQRLPQDVNATAKRLPGARSRM